MRQTADGLHFPDVQRPVDPGSSVGLEDFENLQLQSLPDLRTIQATERITITPANSTSSYLRSTGFSPAVRRTLSSQTSQSTNPESSDRICRCRNHTDDCDRRQYVGRSEICITCHGYFSWSPGAISLFTISTGRETLCCCSWHDRACRENRDNFDARKCKCCDGWFPFSEQANNLMTMPVTESHRLDTYVIEPTGGLIAQSALRALPQSSQSTTNIDIIHQPSFLDEFFNYFEEPSIV